MASKNSSYLWLELNRISQTESPWEVFVKYLSLHAGSVLHEVDNAVNAALFCVDQIEIGSHEFKYVA